MKTIKDYQDVSDPECCAYVKALKDVLELIDEMKAKCKNNKDCIICEELEELKSRITGEDKLKEAGEQ